MTFDDRHVDSLAGLLAEAASREIMPRWLLAGRGTGAFVRDGKGNLSPVRVAEPVEVSQMTGSVSWQFPDEPKRSRVAANHTKCLGPMNYKCAAHDYRVISEGYAEFACFTKLMPWDHLAGQLIRAEAGGYSAKLDGEPYRVGDTTGHLLIAPDRESWAALKREIWDA